ncbi:MAG: GntR family transcriptional regulator [bacterium]
MEALRLHLHLDARNGMPLYRQLMEQLKHYLAAGTLNPGDQLPSIRDLAQSLQVNPATVVKAYSELEHEGILERQHGRGVFVSADPPVRPKREQTETLRRLAHSLAVEAHQAGWSALQIAKLLSDEYAGLEGES